jgi:hypothetical protein
MNIKIKLVTSIALIVLLAVSIFPTRFVVANSIEEQTLQLMSTINSLGEVIRTSPAISEAERVSLFTQLVQLSTAILNLRLLGHSTSPSVQSKERAEDVGLEQVVVRYTPATNIATIQMIFATSTPQERRFEYRSLSEVADFSDHMTQLKNIAITDVSNILNIRESDIRERIMVSARNPIRDSRIFFTPNSALAEELALKFGAHSIVTGAIVYPSQVIQAGEERDEIKGFSIAFTTDQNETLVTTVTRSGNTFFGRRYTLTTEYFLNDAFLMSGINPDLRQGQLPTAFTSLQNITESELKAEVSALFGQIPFASQISDYENKVLRFLFDQSTYLQVGEWQQYSNENRQCYNRADAIIVREMAYQFLKDSGAQALVAPDDVLVVAPVVTIDNSYALSCRNVQRVF